MLHIAPQRRPTAAQLVKHPWINAKMPTMHQSAHPHILAQNMPHNVCHNQNATHTSQSQSSTDGKHLKETVAATYRALANSPQVAHLGPVVMSELARRRFKDKAINRLQHS